MTESNNKKRKKFLYLIIATSIVVLVFILISGCGYQSSKITEREMLKGRESPNAYEKTEAETIIEKAKRNLEAVAPTDVYIVIDRVHNRLWLYENGKMTLEALVSCGAGSILKDPKSDRVWIFDTPEGRFKVKSKRENPLWTAPDWEFIESNEPFPKNYDERIEEGMLGEYALDLNIPGYMIHGTLYERLIGRNVTHGCIRVGRDNLRILWKKVPIGATVFIF